MLANHDFAPVPAPAGEALEADPRCHGAREASNTRATALRLVVVPTPDDPQAKREAASLAPPSGQALFSNLELLVIGIGERDPPSRFKPDGWLARLRRLLFGISTPTPFADRRLETLRLLASALRHGGRSVTTAAGAARAAGVAPGQIEHLLTRRLDTGAATWTKTI